MNMSIKEALANIDGEMMPLSEVRISALDRGFLFGDAVYEVLRVYQGRPWLLKEHFRRLEQSLEAIRIVGVDLRCLQERMMATIAAGAFRESLVYIQITRGSAPRSHAFPEKAIPLEFLYVREFQDHYEQGRRNGIAVLSQPDIRWGRCDIKSTNLLANVLAAQSAREAGCQEVLFYLPDGVLTEGSHSSFFGVLHDTVLTAPNSNDILPGITRSLILNLTARAGIAEQEHVLRRQDLTQVSELFLTGTAAEVLPEVRVEGEAIGDGRPGPITRRLQQAYRQAVQEFLQREDGGE